MKKSIIIGSILVILLALGSRKSITYTATCARCLQYQRGAEKWVGPIRYSHQASDSPNSEARLLGSLPTSDIYQEIFGHPCEHEFKRQGRGVLSPAGIRCGSYGEGRAFEGRLHAVKAIFDLYSRVPDTSLARTSYDILDHLIPADCSIKDAYALSVTFTGSGTTMDQFCSILNIVESEDEWRRANTFFDGGFKGKAPLISDAELLMARMESKNPSIRKQSAAILASNSTLRSTESLSKMLEHDDEKVRNEAVSSVLYGRRLSLFGKVLRVHTLSSYEQENLQRLEDAELNTLFDLDDPLIDALCYRAIADSHRLRLIDVVITHLNARDSAQGKHAMTKLIRGPNPLMQDGEEDQWDSIKPIDLSVDELKSRVSVGYKPRHEWQWEYLPAVKAMGLTKDPTHWEFVHRAYLQQVEKTVAQGYVAVIAKALMELDAPKTIQFLKGELERKEISRVAVAIVGMGLIASPEFTHILEEFRSEINSPSTETPYPTRYNFRDGRYGEFLDYAIHRCQRIQDWELKQKPTGEYFLQR